MKRPPIAGLVLVASLALACRQPEPPAVPLTDFNAFVLEIADALALQDVERLVTHTGRTTLTCDERLAQMAGVCQGLPAGTRVEGFDVKYFGRDELTVLDSGSLRQLLEGMVFGADPQRPADQFGGPRLQLYSTLVPDPVLWFAEDNPERLPSRGDIAITYIGRSPSEDSELKRRLWVAIAERGGDGVWKIRLWLVGFFRPNHPALNPSEENGFQRWSIP